MHIRRVHCQYSRFSKRNTRERPETEQDFFYSAREVRGLQGGFSRPLPVSLSNLCSRRAPVYLQMDQAVSTWKEVQPGPISCRCTARSFAYCRRGRLERVLPSFVRCFKSLYVLSLLRIHVSASEASYSDEVQRHAGRLVGRGQFSPHCFTSLIRTHVFQSTYSQVVYDRSRHSV